MMSSIYFYIQNLDYSIIITLNIIGFFIYSYYSKNPNLYKAFFMLLIFSIISIWETHFFKDFLIYYLIWFWNLMFLIPVGEYDYDSNNLSKLYLIKITNLSIPLEFLKTMLYLITGVIAFSFYLNSLFSEFWIGLFYILILFQIISTFKSLIFYNKSIKENKNLPFICTVSIFIPYSIALLIPLKEYAYLILTGYVISTFVKEYRFSLGNNDLRKRINSITNNFDNEIHLVYVVFALCSIYFPNNLVTSIELITTASILRLLFTEIFRFLGRYNGKHIKSERLLIITAPSFQKDSYSKLIPYLAPSGNLFTNQLNDKETLSNSYIRFLFPLYNCYIFKNKIVDIKSLIVKPLLTHILIHNEIKNDKIELSLENGLNSTFGVVEINYFQLTLIKNKNLENIFLLSYLNDEDLQELNTKNKNQKQLKHLHYSRSLAREKLESSGAIESVRLNIKFLDFLGEREKPLTEALSNLPFEFFAIHRQLYEIPSNSGRFSELFHIYEMIIRYIDCIIKVNQNEEYLEQDLVSMGGSTNSLRIYNKLTLNNHEFGIQINDFFNYKDFDKSSIEVLILFMKRYVNQGIKYSSKPTTLNLFDWITTLRNRTKGHGSTSKIDYNLVYSLNVLLIELLVQFSKFNLQMKLINFIDKNLYSLEFGEGGLPKYQRINNRKKQDEINSLQIKHIGLKEFQNCNRWIKAEEGRIYIYDGVDQKKNKLYWYNFLTGKRHNTEIKIEN